MYRVSQGRPSCKKIIETMLVPDVLGSVVLYCLVIIMCLCSLCRHSWLATSEAGAVAIQMQSSGNRKCMLIFLFAHICPHCCGEFGSSQGGSLRIFQGLAWQIRHVADDHMMHSHQYLAQHVSLVIQRGNTAAGLESMGGGCEVSLESTAGLLLVARLFWDWKIQSVNNSSIETGTLRPCKDKRATWTPLTSLITLCFHFCVKSLECTAILFWDSTYSCHKSLVKVLVG